MTERALSGRALSGTALSGRTIVVLGATGGLGRAVTERLRADGASVLAAGTSIPAAADRQDQVRYIAVDALDEGSVSAAFAAAAHGASAGPPAGPPVGGVVNLIGGYTPPQAVSSLDIGVLRQQLELNLVTAAIITKYAMPMLAARGGGPIVHVSSRVAAGDGANGFAYSVSKLGVVRLVEAAAAEGRADGVRVNCIMPSIIDTPANRAALPGAAHDRWPKPSELAAVLAFLVSDEAVLISGAAVPVYGRA
jgi:NAD(P)-dependent dehydrogenase (short-subunit alcohol dehydrogenase family)